jgi:hypothetical protein
VREGDRLRQWHAKLGRPCDPGRDLGDLDRVRQARAEMVVFGRDEDLALPGKSPPRTRVLHAIEITFEAQTIRIGILVASPRARADGTRRTGGEHRVELGFAFLAATHAAPDIADGFGMRASNDDFFDPQVVDLHRVSVTTPCDNFVLDAGGALHNTEPYSSLWPPR